MNKAIDFKRRIVSSRKSVFLALMTSVASFSMALRQGILLLPLPSYWDACLRINWKLLQDDDDEQLPYTRSRTDTYKYLSLLEMAHYSSAHDALLEQFVEYGYGGS